MTGIPKPRAETVSRVVWRCLDPQHCHSTEAVAARCIERTEAIKKSRESRQSAHGPYVLADGYSEARSVAIADMRATGKTYAQIGIRFGISGSRVMQTLESHRRAIKRESKYLMQGRGFFALKSIAE